MKPYYINLQEIFTQNQKTEMVEYINNNIDKMVAYTPESYAGETDNNNYIIIEESVWKQWTKSFKVQPEYCVMMMQEPGSEVVIHTDDQNKRNAVLSQPLSDGMNETPCLFWETNDYQKFWIADGCFYSGPVILNTQMLHSVPKVKNKRIAFQACYEKPFEEVIEYFNHEN
jgi:hypothetical protein